MSRRTIGEGRDSAPTPPHTTTGARLVIHVPRPADDPRCSWCGRSERRYRARYPRLSLWLRPSPLAQHLICANCLGRWEILRWPRALRPLVTSEGGEA